MPTYSAGSASVQIVPDFSGAQRRIGEWFNRQGDMDMRVNPVLNRSGLQQVNNQINATNSKVKIDVDFRDAERKVAKFLDTLTGFSMVEKQFARLFGPGSILMTTGVGAITALGSAVGGVLPVIGLLPAAIMGAAGPLAALAIGAHGVGAAFKALGVADAASGTSAAASAATRRAAAKQIESAQKGVESAQRGVESAARSLEAADRGVVDAEVAVAKAQQVTVKAQEDLNLARDAAVLNLQDMNMELVRASLNEEAATLAVEQAQQRLNKALGGNEQALQRQWDASIALQRAQLALAQIQDDPRKTALDREAALGAVTQAQLALNQATYDATTARELNTKEADLGFRQAKESLAEIQVRNQRLATDVAAANAAGVEGAANVVAAKDKVAAAVDGETKAQRGLADAQQTVVDAQRGITDASNNLADAQRSLAEAQADAATSAGSSSHAQSAAAAAMAKLSPAAREFVTDVRALKGAWDDLTKSVQESLFAGLGDTITNLANAQLPTLKEGLSGIAAELNSGFKTSMEIFTKPESVKDFATTLGNIKELWHGIAQAAAPFTQAFIDITTVGSQFLPQIGEAIAKMATRFGDFIAKARESGKLAEWFQTGLDTIKQVWTVVSNLTGGIGAILSAAFPAGQELLGMLGTLTGGLKEFLNTDLAQSSLSQFFDQTVKAIGKLQPAFDALVEAAVTGLLPAISGLASAIAPVVNDVLVQFADVVGQLAPLIYPVLAHAISTALAALAPLVTVFGDIVATVLPSVVDLVNQLAPLFTKLAEGVGDGLVKAIEALAPMLPPLVDFIVAVAQAFVDMDLAIVDGILAVLPPLVTVLSAVLQVLTPLAPLLPVILAGIIGWKVAAGIAGMIDVLATKMLGLGLAAERVGASRAANALGNMAGSVQGAGGAVRTALPLLGAVGVALGVIGMAAQANKQQIGEWADAVVQGGKKARDAMAEAADPGIWDSLKFTVGHIFTKEGWSTESIGTLQVRELNKALKEQWDALTPLQQAQQKVTEWQGNLNDRMKKFGEGSPEVEAAQRRLAYWSRRSADEQEHQAEQTKTATDRLKEQQDQIRATVDATLAWDQAQLRHKETQENYDKVMADGEATANDRTQAELDLRQSILSTADAAKAKAEKDNEGKTASDIAKAGSEAYITTLESLSATLTGPAKEAMDQMIADLKNTQDDSALAQQKLVDLGITTNNMPDGHSIKIDAPTAQQKQDLLDLGFTVDELPDHTVVITANTKPAFDVLAALLSQKWTAYIDTLPARSADRATQVSNAKAQIEAAERAGLAAAGINNEFGNILRPFATGGKYSPMAAGIAQVVAPNTWRVIGDRAKDDEAYIPINRSARSQAILEQTAGEMGYALVANAQGWINSFDPGKTMRKQFDYGVSAASLSAMQEYLAGTASLVGAAGSAQYGGVLGVGGTPAGGNSVIQRMFNTVKAAIPQARLNDGYRPGAKDYHGRGLAVDFGFGSGPGGNGSAGLALINRWIYDNWGGRTAELIYDGIGDDRNDLKNGKAYNYGSVLQSQHRNHVHWAMPTFDRGGWLPPGMTTVMNASGRPEPVLTAAEHDSLLRWRSFEKDRPSAPSTVAGFVNNGTVLTTDLDELARKSRRGTQRALMAAGL